MKISDYAAIAPWSGLQSVPSVIQAIAGMSQTPVSTTVTTAMLTPTGKTGTMTFVNGLLTAQTQAT